MIRLALALALALVEPCADIGTSDGSPCGHPTYPPLAFSSGCFMPGDDFKLHFENLPDWDQTSALTWFKVGPKAEKYQPIGNCVDLVLSDAPIFGPYQTQGDPDYGDLTINSTFPLSLEPGMEVYAQCYVQLPALSGYDWRTSNATVMLIHH